MNRDIGSLHQGAMSFIVWRSGISGEAGIGPELDPIGELVRIVECYVNDFSLRIEGVVRTASRCKRHSATNHYTRTTEP